MSTKVNFKISEETNLQVCLDGDGIQLTEYNIKDDTIIRSKPFSPEDLAIILLQREFSDNIKKIQSLEDE